MDPEKFTICNTPTWNKAFEELKAAASIVLAPGLKLHKVELRRQDFSAGDGWQVTGGR